MQRATASAVAVILLMPLFAFAAPGDTVCDQKPQGEQQTQQATSENASSAEDAAAKVGSKSRWTNEQVKPKGDGTFEIVSTCGKEGTPGKIRICFPRAGGTEVCADVDKPENSQDISQKVSGLLKGGPQGIVNEVRRQLKDVVGRLPATERNFATTKLPPEFERILKNAGVPDSYLSSVDAAIKANPADTKKLLEAIIAGDQKAIAEVAAPLQSYGIDTAKIAREAARMFSENPQAVINALPAGARSQISKVAESFCGVFNACGVFAPAAGFVDPNAGQFHTAGAGGGIRDLGLQPLVPGWNGKVDPVVLFSRAVELARTNGLEGRVDPTLQRLGLMQTGSAEEWGRFYTMLARQESGFSIHSAAPWECSYGIYQICPGQYGTRSMADVRDPDQALQAAMRIAQQGKLYQYFGPIQRPNELLQHSGWFDRNIAPYANGTLSYTPGSLSGGGIPRIPGIGAGIGSYLNYGYGSPYSGYGSDYGSGAGAGDPFSNLFSSLGNVFRSLFGGSGSSGGSSSGGSYAGGGAAQPPRPPEPPSSGSGSGTATIAPSLKLTASKKTVTKGEATLIVWAASGVSSCALLEGSAQRATGTSGSYRFEVPGSFAGSKAAFRLECAASDPRISARPSATLDIAIQ